MQLLRTVLFPLSVLYGLAIFFKNLAYRFKIFTSYESTIPTVLVGNISTGGTGKTPFIEKIINLLMVENINIAVLSRGYGRKTSGFLKITTKHTAREAGDELCQIKQKYPKILVIADGDRKRALKKIEFDYPKTQVILMDDGFQHRSVLATISIILKNYRQLNKPQWLLPTGNLREFKSGACRADAQVVTKLPQLFTPMEKRIISNQVKKHCDQPVFFTKTDYKSLCPVLEPAQPSFFNLEYYAERNYQVLCVTGIARPIPLIDKLTGLGMKVKHLRFKDHHAYSLSDIKHIKNAFQRMHAANTIIITTEKDAQRLNCKPIKSALKNLPLFYIAIKSVFINNTESEFKDWLFKKLMITTNEKDNLVSAV